MAYYTTLRKGENEAQREVREIAERQAQRDRMNQFGNRFYYSYNMGKNSFSVFDRERKNQWGDQYCVIPHVTETQALDCVTRMNVSANPYDEAYI